jgi:hypothetical protein
VCSKHSGFECSSAQLQLPLRVPLPSQAPARRHRRAQLRRGCNSPGRLALSSLHPPPFSAFVRPLWAAALAGRDLVRTGSFFAWRRRISSLFCFVGLAEGNAVLVERKKERKRAPCSFGCGGRALLVLSLAASGRIHVRRPRRLWLATAGLRGLQLEGRGEKGQSDAKGHGCAPSRWNISQSRLQGTSELMPRLALVMAVAAVLHFLLPCSCLLCGVSVASE